MAAIVVHTVGHSTHEAPAFVELVRSRGIDLIADVRRYPGSRRVPWTNPGEMRAVLGEAGVAWEHFEELGGRRSPLDGSPNRGWDNEQFQGYADHMASGGFQAALERLMALAAERRAAVMCAEADWRRCHRRLLSDALLARGVEVLHIDPRGGGSPHELTSFAVVENGVITYPPPQGELGV